MGRRNWCSISLEEPSGDLLFDIRVEKVKGHGETLGYLIFAFEYNPTYLHPAGILYEHPPRDGLPRPHNGECHSTLADIL
jgi:hypothetical protein